MKFVGWLEDDAAAAPGPAPVGPMAAVRAAVEARRAHPGTLSAGAGEEILAWNLARGATEGVATPWRALLRGEGVAVIAGQQPALLGGPLYTLYKLLAAVELAAEIERSTGVPAVAVFWLVGDDSDFGEVASTWLADADGTVRRIRDESTPPGGTLIGRLAVARQLAALGLPAGAVAPDLDVLVTAAAAGAGDWSGLVASLVFRLLPGLPCLFLDGAHPAVIREQTPWIRQAATAWPLADLLREGEAEARAAGFEPALDPALGDHAAFRFDGELRIPVADGIPAEGLLGPNVVLRPVIQDLLLPNVATVCGPSEIRYRAQLGPVYRHAGVPRPPLVPRLRAVLLPPGAAADGVLPPRDAFTDPDGYVARRVEAAAPAEFLDRTDGLRERIRVDLASLGSDLGAYDPGLPQLAESAAGKIDFQVARIREGLVSRARQRLLRGDPALARWREFVRPRDGEQERSLSLLAPFLLGGADAGDRVREAARGHLQRLEERRPAAVAVFALPDSGARGRER